LSETFGYKFNVPNAAITVPPMAALWSFINVNENTLKSQVWGWDLNELAKAFIESAIKENFPGAKPYQNPSMMQLGVRYLAKMLKDWRTVQSYPRKQ
jgi:hypothetical protein